MAEPATPSGDVFSMVGSLSDPQSVYRALRDTAPAIRLDEVGILVTTWDLVDKVLHQPETYSAAVSAADLKNERPLIPLQLDPPQHSKYRRILDPLFSPRRMKALGPSIEDRVNELIDRFIDSDEIDFAKQFSVPFPTEAFLTLMGLPLGDLPALLAMKDGIIHPDVVVGKPFGDPDTDAHQTDAARSIYDYFGAAIDERGEDKRDDVFSEIVHGEIDGKRLTREEVLDICFLFLIAGLDTVSASLDCFFGYLSEHPELRRQIIADPSQIPIITEELLRWETPVMAVVRMATRDTEIGGCPVHAGDKVIAMLGSANTDESNTPGADSIMLDGKAHRHLSFGGGAHHCLGSHLARIELHTVLRVWHERIPDYRIKPGYELEFSNGVRALESFPMLLRQTI